MSTTEIKYPEVSVKLVGEDGNAFAVIGRVMQALKRAKVPQADIDQFRQEAMSGDYDNVLATCMKYVDVQ